MRWNVGVELKFNQGLAYNNFKTSRNKSKIAIWVENRTVSWTTVHCLLLQRQFAGNAYVSSLKAFKGSVTEHLGGRLLPSQGSLWLYRSQRKGTGGWKKKKTEETPGGTKTEGNQKKTGRKTKKRRHRERKQKKKTKNRGEQKKQRGTK